MNKREQIITALRAFIDQRSGIDYRNYGDREAFLGDYRPIIKHGKQARTLLRWIAWHESISAEDIMAGVNDSFSGRLQLSKTPEGIKVDYCAGQYFPAEYRRAACAGLARVIWRYYASFTKTTDGIRAATRKEFGPAIQQAWFN